MGKPMREECTSVPHSRINDFTSMPENFVYTDDPMRLVMLKMRGYIQRDKFRCVCQHCQYVNYQLSGVNMICNSCGKAMFIQHCTDDDIVDVSSHCGLYDIGGPGNFCRHSYIPLSDADDGWLYRQLDIRESNRQRIIR